MTPVLTGFYMTATLTFNGLNQTGQRVEYESNRKGSDSKYSEKTEEEGYTPKKLKIIEQERLKLSTTFNERTSINRQKTRGSNKTQKSRGFIRDSF